MASWFTRLRTSLTRPITRRTFLGQAAKLPVSQYCAPLRKTGEVLVKTDGTRSTETPALRFAKALYAAIDDDPEIDNLSYTLTDPISAKSGTRFNAYYKTIFAFQTLKDRAPLSIVKMSNHLEEGLHRRLNSPPLSLRVFQKQLRSVNQKAEVAFCDEWAKVFAAYEDFLGENPDYLSNIARCINEVPGLDGDPVVIAGSIYNEAYRRHQSGLLSSADVAVYSCFFDEPIDELEQFYKDLYTPTVQENKELGAYQPQLLIKTFITMLKQGIKPENFEDEFLKYFALHAYEPDSVIGGGFTELEPMVDSFVKSTGLPVSVSNSGSMLNEREDQLLQLLDKLDDIDFRLQQAYWYCPGCLHKYIPSRSFREHLKKKSNESYQPGLKRLETEISILEKSLVKPSLTIKRFQFQDDLNVDERMILRSASSTARRIKSNLRLCHKGIEAYYKDLPEQVYAAYYSY